MVDRDLDMAFLALREGIVAPDQLREALAECLHDGASLSTLLVTRGLASPDQIAELERRANLPSTSAVGVYHNTVGEHEEATTRRIVSNGHTEGITEDISTEVWTDSGVDPRPSDIPKAESRYRLLRIHGIGGLGRVWLAHDTHLGRDIALKEMRDDRARTTGLVARFVEEAKITSRLEHPGIVSLYDLIEKDEETGLPFYTMRFLAGRTLGAAAEIFHQRRKAEGKTDPLELRALLDAFRAVCQAVAFAHSKEVIHRDLKGQNIILGDFGEVFVIDWGLAKSQPTIEMIQNDLATSFEFDSGSNSAARAETEPGSVLGTPGFIAPEMLNGVPADRRTDIYSLGAILYLILTGRPPYGGESRGMMLQALRDREPSRPRTLVSDAPEALEAICLKALSRDPSARYASPTELAEEVRRWLADEPVDAYQDPVSVKLARWGRSHRTAVLTTSGVLISTVIALLIATPLVWLEQKRTAEQKVHVESQRTRAESNLKLTRKLDAELMRIANEKLSPIPGTERAREEIFGVSLVTFEKSLEENPDDPDLKMWTAQIGRFLANVRRTLNENQAASTSYLRSITLLEELVVRFPLDGFYRAELALVLDDYGHSLVRVGRLKDGAALIHRSVDISELLMADSAGEPEARRTLASSLNSLAAIEGQLGNPVEAARLNRKAIVLYEGLLKLAGEQANRIDPLMMISSLYGLSMAERESDHAAEALAAIEKGLTATRLILGKSPGDNNAAHNMSRLLLEQGRVSSGLEGKDEDADRDIGQAIVGWDKLIERHRPIVTYREWAAVGRQVRGALRGANGRFDDALEDLKASKTALEALVKEFPDILTYQASLGRTYLELGRLARRQKQILPEREWLGQALVTLDKVMKKTPENGRDRRSRDQARDEAAQAGR